MRYKSFMQWQCWIFGLSALLPVSAETRVARLGDDAPTLRAGTVVQGELPNIGGGRPALIEFWAASCGPCVAAMPKLNELARIFNGRINVVWLNAYESVEVVKRFLATHPLVGTVATDSDSATGNAYGVDATPTTALVSAQGKIAGFASTSQLNADILNKLLSGQAMDLSPDEQWEVTSAVPKHHSFLYGELEHEGRSLVRVVVVPTTDEGRWIASATQVESTGSTLRELLAYAYDIPTYRITIPAQIASERYKLQGWVPRDASGNLKRLVQTAILGAAGAQAKVETRFEDALILSDLPGTLEPPSTERAGSRCAPGSVEASRTTVDVLASCLGGILQRTVVPSRSSEKEYSFQLHWNPSEPMDLDRALKQQLGLTLHASRQTSSFLAVTPLR